MNKQEFFDAIKIYDERIIEVTDTPPDIYKKWFEENDDMGFVFALVHSMMFNKNLYMAWADEDLDKHMTKGMAGQIASYFLRELGYKELERSR
jgi:hypothetical protein